MKLIKKRKEISGYNITLLNKHLIFNLKKNTIYKVINKQIYSKSFLSIFCWDWSFYWARALKIQLNIYNVNTYFKID